MILKLQTTALRQIFLPARLSNSLLSNGKNAKDACFGKLTTVIFLKA